MRSFIIIACLLHIAFAAPQLITFKDGQVGVNFLGFHAAAGLGGDQNSRNGLFGGLHASAGTPFGQNAAAGLGGNVNGRASGLLYAGAEAMPGVGAGAVLGGDTSRGGFSGSEAYVPGKTTGVTRTLVAESSHQQDEVAPGVPEVPASPATDSPNAIQKIRPPKKYRGDAANHFKYPNDDDYDFAQLSADNDQNMANNVQQKPDSIVITKTINKTAISSPSSLATKGVRKFHTTPSVAHEETSSPASASSSLSLSKIVHNAAALNGDNGTHNRRVVAQSINESSLSTAVATDNSFDIPIIMPPSSSSSSASLTHLNGENFNENLNDKTIVSVREHAANTRTKLRSRQQTNRNRPHHHLHHHHHQHQQRKLQQRINLNQERQRSKTIIRTVHAGNVAAATEKQTTQRVQQQNVPQQHIRRTVEKRQLIAPQSSSRADVQAEQNHQDYNGNGGIVFHALQIPVGILQSLQKSLGGLK